MRWAVFLLLGLLAGCCEGKRLVPGSVLMSEQTLDALAQACRMSSLDSEQDLLVFGITDLLKSLHMKSGEQPQDCRIQRDGRCSIVKVNCAPNQTGPQAPAHCATLLERPPADENAPSPLPCGCGGKRRPKWGAMDFDRYSLTELDKIALDTQSAGRSQALEKVVRFALETWRQKQASGFTAAHRPKLRAPGAACPRAVHFERLKQGE